MLDKAAGPLCLALPQQMESRAGLAKRMHLLSAVQSGKEPDFPRLFLAY